MISCEVFRRRFTAGTEDPALLEHLRACDACLEAAVAVDPDAMFRSLGGEMTPPGGVDAFVSDVMRQVHVRSAENAIGPAGKLHWTRKLAIAATLSAAAVAGLLVYRNDQPTFDTAPVPRAVLSLQASAPQTIESYESQNATILEVPSDGQSDVKVVMIFDESLPKDL